MHFQHGGQSNWHSQAFYFMAEKIKAQAGAYLGDEQTKNYLHRFAAIKRVRSNSKSEPFIEV